MCLKERFFCQYLCPMGAIFAWLPVLPFSVLDRDRSNCIPKCRACEIKCPVDYQIKRDQKNGGECIHCMQCVDVCPKQNIHLCSGLSLIHIYKITQKKTARYVEPEEWNKEELTAYQFDSEVDLSLIHI